LHAVALYGREKHRPAEALQTAILNDAVDHAVLPAVVGVLLLVSVLLWRRVRRSDVGAEAV
jgi:hypothetical protein